ncbi:MAG: hypothetical protein Q4B63_11720 [Clostridium perfringens]|nr:hypothetical protein [Clostridium perfringens]
MKKEWINPKVNILGASETANFNLLGEEAQGWLPNGCHQECGQPGKFPQNGGHHPNCTNRPNNGS